ncbi:FecR domain-containing protein [Candidatus Peregrinibacteria bacterium]|nr:FecR domain-containing protein [Candidatus Peregrinibacteria bacterium]
MLPDSSPPADETATRALFAGIQTRLEPPLDAKLRIQRRILRTIEAPAVLKEVRRLVEPSAAMQGRTWRAIAARLANLSSPIVRPAGMFWQNLRGVLTPENGAREHIWTRLTSRLHPAEKTIFSPLRWAAVCAVFVLLARVTAFLMLPPTTIAESPILLLPKGDAFLSVGDGKLLQQVTAQEVEIKHAAVIQTGNRSSATLLLRDRAVVRLDANTTIALDDVTDTLRPATLPSHTLTFVSGRIWVQSFLPSGLPGVTIATAQGNVIVHEGSVSMASASDAHGNGIITVLVADRRATIVHGAKKIPLVAGERTALAGAPLLVKKMMDKEYADAWVRSNLSLDAVHQQEIVALQQRRRVASAGILPNSLFYPVKRAMEKVDLALTLSPQARVEKQLLHADTRLSEAAALLNEGNTDASGPLHDYRAAILAVADGTGSNVGFHNLVQTQLAQTAADVAALETGNKAYPLKVAVLETTAAVPGSSLKPEDVQGMLVVDALAAIKHTVEAGDLAKAKADFENLQSQSSLTDLERALPEDVRNEADSTFTNLAITLGDEKKAATIVQVPALSTSLSDAEVLQSLRRIRTYKGARGQYNQFVLEMRMIKQRHRDDEGRVLRLLLRYPPSEDVRHFAELEVRRLHQELLLNKAKGGTGAVQTATGPSL